MKDYRILFSDGRYTVTRNYGIALAAAHAEQLCADGVRVIRIEEWSQ